MFKNSKITVLEIILLLLIIGLSGFTDLMGDDYGGILAEKLDEVPETFYNLTDEYREEYPTLYQSINLSGEQIKIPSDEYYRVKDFLGGSELTIKYSDEYYLVRLFGTV